MKNKFDTIDLKDVPDDVMWVWAIQLSCRYGVGMATIEKMERIINENPKYFVWEHKYKSIPKEVHEAFIEECYPNKPVEFNNDVKRLSIYEELSKPYEPAPPLTEKSLFMLIEEMVEKEERRKQLEKAEHERVKKIWDKHYSKYDLKFR